MESILDIAAAKEVSLQDPRGETGSEGMMVLFRAFMGKYPFRGFFERSLLLDWVIEEAEKSIEELSVLVELKGDSLGLT